MICLKKLCVVVLVLLPLRANGQVVHKAVISWPAPADANAAGPSTYNVYRANGYCPSFPGLGSLVFTKVNAVPITALTYTDSGLVAGVYCWYATQLQTGAESAPSNTGVGGVRPNTVTIQGVIT